MQHAGENVDDMQAENCNQGEAKPLSWYSQMRIA